MTAQSDLLFALPPEPTATVARDKAIDRVERANRSWVAVASRIICEFSKSREEFSSDDVLPLLGCLGPRSRLQGRSSGGIHRADGPLRED